LLFDAWHLSPTRLLGNEYRQKSAIRFAAPAQFNSKMLLVGDGLLTQRRWLKRYRNDRGEFALPWNLLASPQQETKPRIPNGMRVYAIGDVHGRVDLLNAAFERIDATLTAHPIKQSVQVFLGDYIDRGPNSREVIDALIARKKQHAVVCLKGNHESYAVQFLSDPSVLTEWRQFGGDSTLLSYEVKPSTRSDPQPPEVVAEAFSKALPSSHRRFLEGLGLSFTCGDFFFTHAGVRPGIPLGQQREHDLLWIREDFLLHEEDFGKIIVHGHTPAKEPDVRPNRINIDTGAYATGRLTCLVLQADRMVFI
jgi:serine/threonine protein phosphatase 1